MKPERAQELYSDYAEGTLTPALRQALEQHFTADPSARAEYAQFKRVYSLLDAPEEEQQVPLGFRAKILERVAAQQAPRETTWSQRVFAGWFSTVPHRRAAGGALAGLAVALGVGVIFIHPGSQTATSSIGPTITLPAATDPAVIQRVDLQAGPNGNAYHLFHLHLPPAVPAATVSAYVVTATEQITDPAHLGEATPALAAQRLTNRQGVQIPIAPLQAAPAGATLNLLVQWTPDDARQPAGSEVVFTPFGAASSATAAPAGASFLDAMEAVASRYGATVVVDADSVPTQTVSADFSAPAAEKPLKDLAAAAGYAVQVLPNNTFYVYDPKS